MIESWKTVVVVGVGLIGGSFALALRKAGFKGRIIGVSSVATVKAALALGVIDEALPLDVASERADMVYVAQPIEQILASLSEVDAAVRPGTLITDTGSTKSAIVDRAARVIQRGRFVGGHPMAGKESRGVQSAEAGLFEGRPYVLTGSDPELEHWIAKIGARLVRLDAAVHDRLVAKVSHLPQVLSTALALALGKDSMAAQVAGPAASDMTRLAMSPYEVWHPIFATNSAHIEQEITGLIGELERLRKAIGQDESLAADFERAAEASLAFRKTK